MSLCLVLVAFGCGGGGGGGDDVAGVPAPVDGAYEGYTAKGDAMCFLVGESGKGVLNFTLYRPPEIDIDLVADLNKTVFPIQVEGDTRVFYFTIKQPTLEGSVKGIFRDNHLFECHYLMQTASNKYSGIINCVLTLSKTALGQTQKTYSFRDISVTVGAVNILKEGRSISFGDFNNDSIDDLFVPCSPSLYRYVWGSLNGLGYYLVDATGKYGTPDDSRTYSLWTDVDSDGWLDLIAGGEMYRNVSFGGTLLFDNTGAQIGETDPPYYLPVDYNGDNDLDVFTGLWHTNKQDEDLNPPFYELVFQQDYNVNYTKNSGTLQAVFGPLEFDPSEQEPDVDLDLVEMVDVLGNQALKLYRCDRGPTPADPVTFIEDNSLPATLATASSMAFGDVDNDLKLDLLVIGKDQGSTKLYRNITDALTKPVNIEFEDVTNAVFSASGLAIPVGGDADFADYDNDGWLDFFVAAPFGESTHKLYRNTTGEKGFLSFADATAHAKIITDHPSGTYSRCTWCDLDNNGAMDLALGVYRLLLFQNAGGQNRFIRVAPMTNIGQFQPAKRAALGAIVLVDRDQDGAFDLIRCIEAGRHNHLIAHFGLGPNVTTVDVLVYFPDGGPPVPAKDVNLDLLQANPLKIYDNN